MPNDCHLCSLHCSHSLRVEDGSSGGGDGTSSPTMALARLVAEHEGGWRTYHKQYLVSRGLLSVGSSFQNPSSSFQNPSSSFQSGALLREDETVASGCGRREVLLDDSAETTMTTAASSTHTSSGGEAGGLLPVSLRASSAAQEAGRRQAGPGVAASMGVEPWLGPLPSAVMSIIPLLPEDTVTDPTLFPKGMTDVHGQQLDLRTSNSWLLSLPDVSSPELAEVMAVNAMAPFILNGRLKPMLLRAVQKQQQQTPPPSPPPPPHSSDDDTTTRTTTKGGAAYVINVSAMEGKFYRHKSPHHPHTNMAKAALNMLTRTSAEEYAQHGIYMNSVDTGWINDENPLPTAAKTATTNHFQTPLDEIDAAMRILDPVFLGEQERVADRQWPFGKFFKDYRETDW